MAQSRHHHHRHRRHHHHAQQQQQQQQQHQHHPSQTAKHVQIANEFQKQTHYKTVEISVSIRSKYKSQTKHRLHQCLSLEFEILPNTFPFSSTRCKCKSVNQYFPELVLVFEWLLSDKQWES